MSMRRFTILLLIVATAAPLWGQSTRLSARLKELAFGKQPDEAIRLIEQRRAEGSPRDPQFLEALSWVARGTSFVGDWETAERYAQETYQAALPLATKESVSKNPALATALGASIEVLGQSLAARGDRAAAIEFLGRERDAWRRTPIETRIQKNYLLVGLEGEPMPELEAEEFIGQPAPIDTAGKVGVFYFWAHWCSDCKTQKPILEELHAKYADADLKIIAPTKLYGYAGRRRDLSPAEEIAYLEGPWQQEHGLPDWMPKPLSQENFLNFGVSTTPTLVIVDREGVVREYHPGWMTLEELVAAVKPLL